ncbi:MAG TPA: hypothetical protein VEJ84_07780, partial [Acidimicrobiales bacterium]|nr:hypothetical protein [Acidimicrobiales bacterium]
GVALRPLERFAGWGPEPEVVDLAGWAAWRWAGRRRSLLVTASSLTLVRQLPPVPAAVPSPPPPRRDSRRGEVVALVEQAFTSGAAAHILRLPPATGATDLVLAAATRGPVLVVAPTTARAQAGCTALRDRGADVALLPGDWARARGGARVVIGARAAAWGPCPGLAAVVVLDAHDESLVQQQAPTWDAATVAAQRAHRADVPCLWTSACPTLEMLHAAGEPLTVSRSAEREGWALTRVIDLRQEDPRTGLIPPGLVPVLRHARGRVVCVLNRTGRAVLLDCGACRAVATCERCGAAVSMVGGRLVCRRCQEERPVVCLECGSSALRLLRPGVARVREQLEALAGRPVGEVTAATKSLPGSPVLVGTEAVLYRDTELRHQTEAVAFLDFDQELLAPRYRAGEQALALLARASRIVGGRTTSGGAVVVQTRLPSHPVIVAAAAADPARLAAEEEPVRKALRFPPYAALAALVGPGAAELASSLAEAGDREPAAAVEVNPLADDHWLVRGANYEHLANMLATTPRPTNRVRVEVGPVRF